MTGFKKTAGRVVTFVLLLGYHLMRTSLLQCKFFILDLIIVFETDLKNMKGI